MVIRDTESKLPGNVLLIGPLPPPFGGARVSFQLFLDEVMRLGQPGVLVVNAPIRTAPAEKVPGPVHHFKTLGVVLRSLGKLKKVDAVWIFCSAGFGMSYALIYLIACRLMHIPTVVRFFGGHPYLHALRIWQPLRDQVDTVLGFAQKIVLETDIGRREFPPFLQKRARVVHGYRQSQIESISKDDISQDCRTVKFYYAGLISREKGSFLLLDAFMSADRILKKSGVLAELHLFGVDADAVSECMNGSKCIHYHGVVDNDSLLRLLDEFDVLAFPSLYQNEGHSGTIIEAMMAGKPVICFDLPGPAEIVKDDVNGIVVPCGSKDHFASAIVRLSRDSDLRRRLSTGARQESKKFDAKIAVPKLLEVMSGGADR